MSNDKLAATFGPFKVGDRVEVNADDCDNGRAGVIIGSWGHDSNYDWKVNLDDSMFYLPFKSSELLPLDVPVSSIGDDLDRLSMVAILGILQDHADGATTKGQALKAVSKIVTKKWGGVIDRNN